MISFFTGLILGFTSAIPVAGPVSAVILSKTLQGSSRQARSIAYGAGLVEGLYSYLAFIGYDRWLKDRPWLTSLTNILLIITLFCLGAYFYLSKSLRTPAGELPDTQTKGAFFIGATMSAGNPTLIATWAATISLLSSFHLFKATPDQQALFSVGVGSGIILWFLLMITLIKKHRESFQGLILDRILKLTGILLGGVSIFLLWRYYHS